MSFERGHALVIGVGTYVHIPWANIPISVVDAQAITDVLGNVDLCGYPPEQVTLLHDATASKGGILGELVNLSKVAEDHTVLVFYCGHGADGTDGNYYLTTHESQVSNGKVVKGTGISEGELLDALRKIKAKRLILLFNACHSGEISPNLGPEDQPNAFGGETLPETAVDALLSTGEGRVIITASRPDQKSWIGTGKLTIFTQALVDGLSGKGTVNNHGFIGAFDLYEHVYEAVKAAAGGLGQVQEPELTVLRGVGPFAVTLYKGALSLGTFDESETDMAGTSIRQVETARSQRLYQKVVKNITASGERSVAAETISGSTVVTGDHNLVQSGKYNIQMGNVQGAVIGDNARGPAAFSWTWVAVTTWAVIRLIHGDEVHGDKIGGDKNITGGPVGLSAGTVRVARMTIYQGSNPVSSQGSRSAEQLTPLIEEPIRLDVAVPDSIVLDEPFDLAVAVRQPESPPLSIEDLEQVRSGSGKIFRAEKDEIIRYRIELAGSGFVFVPSYFVLKLRPREDSSPRFFQVTALRPGKRSLVVNAFQEDESLAAQTRIRIEVTVPVRDS